jgi:hypothetical protein
VPELTTADAIRARSAELLPAADLVMLDSEEDLMASIPEPTRVRRLLAGNG